MPDSALGSQAVRLAIISNQEVVMRGLTAMLADYPQRVVVVALESAWSRALSADVVLYDTVNLHNSDGGELDHLLHATDVRVLIYSRDMRPDLRARALGRGADAWISMSTRALELVEAVEMTAAGVPLREEVSRTGETVGLSEREVETLALITQGLSNQEIADELFLTINTLKTHIRQAYRKIGVATRAQAVAWCMQNGFIAEK